MLLSCEAEQAVSNKQASKPKHRRNILIIVLNAISVYRQFEDSRHSPYYRNSPCSFCLFHLFRLFHVFRCFVLSFQWQSYEKSSETQKKKAFSFYSFPSISTFPCFTVFLKAVSSVSRCSWHQELVLQDKHLTLYELNEPRRHFNIF